MTATARTRTDPTAGRCPNWCDLDRHQVEDDGAILHARQVGSFWIMLMDHMLADGARGYGEVIVECPTDYLATATQARQLAADLEQVAAILDGIDHVADVHDNTTSDHQQPPTGITPQGVPTW